MGDKRRFNRGLSEVFLAELKAGCFARLLAESRDNSLDVQIRENYVNFYHKGRSVLLLAEQGVRSPRYRARIHWKYLDGIALPADMTTDPDGDYRCFEATGQFVEAYVQNLLAILSKANEYSKKEADLEQIMIRASHGGSSPVIFIDRQVQVHGIAKKADLVGLTSAGQFVITELKQGLDNRIQHLMEQICDYHSVMAEPAGCLREEILRSYCRVVQQKEILGLLPRDIGLPDASAQVTCLIVLHGYSPTSTLLDRLRQASAAHRIRVSLVQLSKESYTLPPVSAWEQLCPV